MNTILNVNPVLFEHHFWLQVLGDHSRFILNALAPDEKENIAKATSFITLFDELLEKSRVKFSPEDEELLTMDCLKAAKELQDFKLSLLKLMLEDKPKINMTPTFINHMLNELGEYIQILYCIIGHRPLTSHPVHYNLLWLLDGSGHASAIASDLDMAEKRLIKISNRYAKDFDNLYLKTVEVWGYLRTGLETFPALKRLNNESRDEMLLFMEFLTDLETLIRKKEALGSLMPLMLDHMYREECYYLAKLSSVSDIQPPDCDPTKPRKE